MPIDEFWAMLGRSMGASEEQVADLVRRMTTETDSTTNKKNIEKR